MKFLFKFCFFSGKQQKPFVEGSSQKAGKQTATTQSKEGCLYIYKLGVFSVLQLQPKRTSLREKPIFAL